VKKYIKGVCKQGAEENIREKAKELTGGWEKWRNEKPGLFAGYS
jgi:hypothetical protein